MIDHLLTHTLSLWRPETTTDTGGGQVLTFTQVGTVRAKVNQPTPAEREVAAAWGALLSHVVHTPFSDDIRRGDEFGGDLPSDIQVDLRLRVLAVISDSHETYKRAECQVVQAEIDVSEGSSS